MNDMKKQLDSRWRQIDRFETSVRTLADAKLQWKKKMAGKEGEIDALKVRDFSRPLYVFVMDLTTRFMSDHQLRAPECTLQQP